MPLLPDEAITISAAVDAFTRGVAYVNHEEDVAGTLELGKLADIAVLTQDIYAVPPTAIGAHHGRADGRRRTDCARRRIVYGR